MPEPEKKTKNKKKKTKEVEKNSENPMASLNEILLNYNDPKKLDKILNKNEGGKRI